MICHIWCWYYQQKWKSLRCAHREARHAGGLLRWSLHATYLSNGQPLGRAVFADDAVGHADKVLAELLDTLLAAVGGISWWLCGDISSQRQQLDEGHHVCWLQSLLLGVLQGLHGDVQQGRCLGEAGQGWRLLPQHGLRGAETLESTKTTFFSCESFITSVMTHLLHWTEDMP